MISNSVIRTDVIFVKSKKNKIKISEIPNPPSQGSVNTPYRGCFRNIRTGDSKTFSSSQKFSGYSFFSSVYINTSSAVNRLVIRSKEQWRTLNRNLLSSLKPLLDSQTTPFSSQSSPTPPSPPQDPNPPPLSNHSTSKSSTSSPPSLPPTYGSTSPSPSQSPSPPPPLVLAPILLSLISTGSSSTATT